LRGFPNEPVAEIVQFVRIFQLTVNDRPQANI